MMESMPAKIVGDVNSWNESVNAQMDTDNTVIHATLTSRMQEAAAALHSLQGKMGTKNGNLQAQYDGMMAKKHVGVVTDGRRWALLSPTQRWFALTPVLDLLEDGAEAVLRCVLSELLE